MADDSKKQGPDENEQIRHRVNKLKELQAEGKDPFQITSDDQTETEELLEELL